MRHLGLVVYLFKLQVVDCPPLIVRRSGIDSVVDYEIVKPKGPTVIHRAHSCSFPQSWPRHLFVFTELLRRQVLGFNLH